MLKVEFHETYEDQQLKFAVLVTQYDNRWVFCKHKPRGTKSNSFDPLYEIPCVHREPGEDILSAAERELYKETGAVSYTVREICAYSVIDTDSNVQTFGMLYFADIISFTKLPDFELEKIALTESLPEQWTYPLIQPKLIEKVCSVVKAS